MRAKAVIFGMRPGFRVALYELSQHSEVWIADFSDLAALISALYLIGILDNEELLKLADFDFTHNFPTTQAEINLLDALAAGFLPYKKTVTQ